MKKKAYFLVLRAHTLGHCGAEGMGSEMGGELISVHLSRETAEAALEREYDRLGGNDEGNWCSQCGRWAAPSPSPAYLEIVEGSIELPDEVMKEIEGDVDD